MRYADKYPQTHTSSDGLDNREFLFVLF